MISRGDRFAATSSRNQSTSEHNTRWNQPGLYSGKVRSVKGSIFVSGVPRRCCSNSRRSIACCVTFVHIDSDTCDFTFDNGKNVFVFDMAEYNEQQPLGVDRYRF